MTSPDSVRRKDILRPFGHFTVSVITVSCQLWQSLIVCVCLVDDFGSVQLLTIQKDLMMISCSSPNQPPCLVQPCTHFSIIVIFHWRNCITCNTVCFCRKLASSHQLIRLRTCNSVMWAEQMCIRDLIGSPCWSHPFSRGEPSVLWVRWMYHQIYSCYQQYFFMILLFPPLYFT